MQCLLSDVHEKGVRCVRCGGVTHKGVQVWEMVLPDGEKHLEVLCYICAIVFADEWVKAGGKLGMNP